MLTGQNGILNRAAEAKEKTEKSQVEENETLNDYEQEIDDVVSNISQVDDAEPGKLEEVNGEYIINSIEDLVVFSAETINGENNYEGKTVKLGESLDFKSKKSWPWRSPWARLCRTSWWTGTPTPRRPSPS